LGVASPKFELFNRLLAVPILDRFRTWLEEQRLEVLPKSPMGEAISYALNNRAALVRYTEAGFLAIDNNVSEREMKRIAIGRKNWLSIGSPRGGQTAAVFFSFTSTCQRLGVEPWHYLRDVLERLPRHPPQPFAELLPDEWARAQRGVAEASLSVERNEAVPPPSG
jgi:transposase